MKVNRDAQIATAAGKHHPVQIIAACMTANVGVPAVPAAARRVATVTSVWAQAMCSTNAGNAGEILRIRLQCLAQGAVVREDFFRGLQVKYLLFRIH